MAVLTAAQVAGIASQGTPSGTTVAEWVQVAKDESSYRTDALSPTGCCRGLWQINVSAHRDLIPETKVSIANGHAAMQGANRNWELAKLVYAKQGWRAWSVVKGARPVPSAEARAAAAAPDFSVANSGGAVGGKPEEGVQPVDPISAVADSLFGGFQAIVEFLNRLGAWVSDAHNWTRVGYVVGGAALVLAAGSALASDTKAGQTVTAVVSKGLVTPKK